MLIIIISIINILPIFYEWSNSTECSQIGDESGTVSRNLSTLSCDKFFVTCIRFLKCVISRSVSKIYHGFRKYLNKYLSYQTPVPV